jgi:hypothetical protein
LITSRLGGLTKLGTVASVPRMTSKLCPCTVDFRKSGYRKSSRD